MSATAIHRRTLIWGALACLAVALPMLIAFNVPPSATLFNQVAAHVGWGALLVAIGAAIPSSVRPRASEALALLAAFGVLVAACLASSLWASAPWTLTVSAAATILSAAVAATVASAAVRAGHGEPAFRAFCFALVVAGATSGAIGWVQVFVPAWPDGDWVAPASIVGRATSNLRQPNHLSTLLLWSIVAVVWLGEARLAWRRVAAVAALLFLYVIVLSASRTGALGTVTLALWGVLDRRLSRGTRVLLALAPVAYFAMWTGMIAWAQQGQVVFGGQGRFSGGDLSTSRFAIWSNALALIAAHPWFGVGFGEFNFAWTLTPFPGRPVEFFDHTHNLVLNFAVELGIPLALLVLGLLLFALWRGLGNALADGRLPPGDAAARSGAPPMQRAALVMIVLVAVHSLLEYPLWYAYFLLPAAFAFGLCLERPDPDATARAANPEPGVTRPFVIAAMLLVMGGTLALYDYQRVVVIFVPPGGAAPLEDRIADGRRSVLFGHHGDYAAGTVVEHPGKVIDAFRRAPHFLLDSRLMMAWARALDEVGEVDKARHLAARLKEFRNPQADAFFAACDPPAAASAPASAPAKPPFQCQAPARALRFEDFR